LLQLALSILPSPAPGEEWTRFRGPNGSGVSKDTAFPVEFAKNKNAIWRVPARRGKSSPVAPVILAAITILASLFPVYHAVRIDPAQSLREG